MLLKPGPIAPSRFANYGLGSVGSHTLFHQANRRRRWPLPVWPWLPVTSARFNVPPRQRGQQAAW